MRKNKKQPEVKQARFNVNDLTDYDIDVLLKKIGARLTRQMDMSPNIITIWPTGVPINPNTTTWTINGNG